MAKLFFKRAPECRPALGAALAAGASDPDPSVSERALLYHRLLAQAGPEQAQAVIAAPRPMLARFEEAQSAEVADKIFDEWNSLSVVYRAPAATFIEPGELGPRVEVDSIGEAGGSEEDLGAGANGGTALLLDLESEAGSESGTHVETSPSLSASDLMAGLSGPGGEVSSTVQSTPAAQQQPAAGTGGGLSALDMLGDLMGTGGGNDTPVIPAGVASNPVPLASAAPSGFDDFADMFGGAAPAPAPASAPPAAPQTTGFGDLTGLDDFFGMGGGNPTPPTAATAPAPSGTSHEDVSLVAQPSITADQYKSKWAQWTPTALTFTQELGGAEAVAAIEARGFRDFLSHVAQGHITSFATPREGAPPPHRFLFVAQRQGSGEHVLSEVTVTRVPAVAAVTVKSADAAAAAHVKELLQTLLLTI